MEIRRSWDRLISTMGFPILVRLHLYIESGPWITIGVIVNTLKPRQNCRQCADEIFKCVFLNENVRISLRMPLNFVPKGSINNITALAQTMAWCRPSDKPLSEPMMFSWLTHSVTRPQWVNCLVIVNWTMRNKILWNLNQNNKQHSFKKMHLKIPSARF